jgi:hypothetical protein
MALKSPRQCASRAREGADTGSGSSRGGLAANCIALHLQAITTGSVTGREGAATSAGPSDSSKLLSRIGFPALRGRYGRMGRAFAQSFPFLLHPFPSARISFA